MTKNSNFSLNSNPNDGGAQDDFTPQLGGSQVKVKQFMPGQSMGGGMRKSNVRFAGENTEIGQSAIDAEDQ